MFTGRAGRRPQDARRNSRLGDFIAHDHPAVRAHYWLALEVGQLAVAQRPLEVIAHDAILFAHVARPVQRLATAVISGLLVRGGPGIDRRKRPRRPHGGYRQQ